ncbi:MAG: MBL fold metallo-hydrolase, partial [Deltaproteobacteria bacterium]|nr:MBL fold metallo-hydrolase [Deltaproteobacteria bacterium]
LDPCRIGMILITHLHGDHFGGLPFFLLDARVNSLRTAPLTLVGPQGMEAHLWRTFEALYPGAGNKKPPFPLRFVELKPGLPQTIQSLRVSAFAAQHPVAGSSAATLKIETEDKCLVVSGDTGWNRHLEQAAQGADLLVLECTLARPLPDTPPDRRSHLDVFTLQANRHRLKARRVILTHMGADVLANPPPGWELAHDGLEIVL